MGRYALCDECIAHLAAAGGSRVVDTVRLGQRCEIHPSGVGPQAYGYVDFAGPLPAPFSSPASPPTLPPPPRRPEALDAPPAPIGPLTEIAARLLVVWLADEPFEAQREDASDRVMVSRAASVARMLLAETRNL